MTGRPSSFTQNDEQRFKILREIVQAEREGNAALYAFLVAKLDIPLRVS